MAEGSGSKYEIPRFVPILNALQEAIYDVLGGPSPAARRLNVTRQAIDYLLRAPWVRNRQTALKIEEVSGIPAAELMGLVPWRGPERAAKRRPHLSGAGAKGRARARAKSTLSNSHATAIAAA